MSVVRRIHTREFKTDLCERIKLGQISKSAACRQYDLAPSMLDRWCSKYEASGADGFKDNGVISSEQRIKELEASLGRAHLENEFLREALGKLGIPVKRSQ